MTNKMKRKRKKEEEKAGDQATLLQSKWAFANENFERQSCQNKFYQHTSSKQSEWQLDKLDKESFLTNSQQQASGQLGK